VEEILKVETTISFLLINQQNYGKCLFGKLQQNISKSGVNGPLSVARNFVKFKSQEVLSSRIGLPVTKCCSHVGWLCIPRHRLLHAHLRHTIYEFHFCKVEMYYN